MTNIFYVIDIIVIIISKRAPFYICLTLVPETSGLAQDDCYGPTKHNIDEVPEKRLKALSDPNKDEA